MTQPTPNAIPPEALLFHLVATLLAPMFLTAAGGDLNYARLAAIETINAYRAQNHASLLAVAQIVAFGLAALGSLSLSMADDLTLNMTIRLRGNANALDRSAERNRRALGQPAATPQPEEPLTDEDRKREAEVIASVAAAQQAAAEAESRTRTQPKPREPLTSAQEQQNRAMWAAAIADVAGEFTASLPHLPPEERKLASRKAGIMSSSIAALLSGDPLPRPEAGSLAALMRAGPA